MTTLASDIIQRAYREGQITAIVSAPNSTEQGEALPLLNSIILSSIGYEVGTDIAELNIGGTYDQSSCVATFVPANVRLVLNLSQALSYKLHPQPYDGMRLAVADAGNNLATHNLTLDGNGRQIEGTATLVLSANGTQRQWLYRADTANWVKITSLATSDAMPFPVEYDDYFVIKLAMRLFPRNGVGMTKESAAYLQRIESGLKARYRKPRPKQDVGTGTFARNNQFGLSVADFNAGRTD